MLAELVAADVAFAASEATLRAFSVAAAASARVFSASTLAATEPGLEA